MDITLELSDNRMKSSALSILWLSLAGLLCWTRLEHGRLLGGVEYFAHMGQSGSATLQTTLIIGSFLLALAIWLRSEAIRIIAIFVGVLALLFFVTLMGWWLPLPVRFLLSGISPRVFPLGLFWVALPFTVFACAVATYFTYPRRKSLEK